MINLTERMPQIFSAGKVTRFNKIYDKCEALYDRNIIRENVIAEQCRKRRKRKRSSGLVFASPDYNLKFKKLTEVEESK